MDNFHYYNNNPFCQEGQMCDHRPTKYVLPRNDTATLRKIQTFKIEKYARRMCVFAGAIWLPCFTDNCIMVYSLDGLLLQVVENFRIQKPLGLCEYDKEHLLVAADNGLFLMEDPPRGIGQTMVFDTANEGKMISEVRKGSFCDVFILNPHVLSLEYKQGRVYITTYKTSYGRLVNTTTSFNLNYETDYLDSIHMKDDFIFIASCTQHCIIKYNIKGIMLSKYGHLTQEMSSGPGNLMFPSICNTQNRLGLILIADAMNNRLQALDDENDGKWCVLYDHGVKWPVDAVLSDDNTMLVLCGKLNDYKIYKFDILIPYPEESSQSCTI